MDIEKENMWINTSALASTNQVKQWPSKLKQVIVCKSVMFSMFLQKSFFFGNLLYLKIRYVYKNKSEFLCRNFELFQLSAFEIYYTLPPIEKPPLPYSTNSSFSF